MTVVAGPSDRSNLASEAPGVPSGGADSSGIVWLAAANAVYTLGGWALTVVLAHLLGPAGFGAYGVLAGFMTVLNMVMARGLPMAASRKIAASPGEGRAIVSQSARLLAPAAFLLAAGAAIVAWPLSEVLGARELREEMQIGALAAITFAINGLLLAHVNGTRSFVRQSLAQASYGLGRVATIVGGAWLAGLGGAVIGFVVSPLLGSIPLLRRIPADSQPERDHRQELVTAAIPFVLTATTVNFLMLIDLFAFQRVAEAEDVGIYMAAATLAHVPYFLMQAAALVIMPVVAGARSAEARRQVVGESLGTTMALVALPTAVLVAVGDVALVYIFGNDYAHDGLPVAALAAATAAVTLHGAFVAIDAGMQRLREAVALGVISIVAIAVAVSIAGAGSQVDDAAVAVMVVCIALAVVHGGLIWWRTRAVPPGATIVAIAASCAIAGLSGVVQDSVLGLVLVIGTGGLLYLVLLRALGLAFGKTARAHPDQGAVES